MSTDALFYLRLSESICAHPRSFVVHFAENFTMSILYFT